MLYLAISTPKNPVMTSSAGVIEYNLKSRVAVLTFLDTAFIYSLSSLFYKIAVALIVIWVADVGVCYHAALVMLL